MTNADCVGESRVSGQVRRGDLAPALHATIKGISTEIDLGSSDTCPRGNAALRDEAWVVASDSSSWLSIPLHA